MQASKKNTNRKRKERPLTSYFTAVATVPVVARAPAAVAVAAAEAVVNKQHEKSDGIGEKGRSSVDVDVESTTPTVVQPQSTKQAKTSASNHNSKNKKEVEVNLSASDDDDSDDDIAISDLKKPKMKIPPAKKGRMHAASATEKKPQQRPDIAVAVATSTSRVPKNTAEVKRLNSSDEGQEKSDGIGEFGIESTTPTAVQQKSTKGRMHAIAASKKEKNHQQESVVAVAVATSTNTVPMDTATSSGNENAVEALQDCTNAGSSAELEEATKNRQKNDGHPEDTSVKRPSAATVGTQPSRSRSLPPSTNVVHQLFSRSVHGGRKKNCSVSAPQPAWKIPSWIDLCPGNSSARNSGIKMLAWDEMGVLLAAYCDDRCIRIYDWDMVVAANVKGRNRRTRQAAYNKKDTECLMIEPILVFPYPFGNVSVLKWNPFNPDELAVANRCVRCVRLYFCVFLLGTAD
jgi:hypothetical protein